MIPPDAQNATPMFVLLLKELADLKARSLTNQMVSERILELLGEERSNIHATVVKIHADSRDAALKQLISRLQEMFPDAPPDFYRAFSE